MNYFVEAISTFYYLIPASFLQGLIYAFVAMGIMIPIRTLNFPDLTSEGSFPLGGCVFAACAFYLKLDPFTAMLIAILCGFCAGLATAYFYLRFHINTLLCGIIVLTMLYSVNLIVMKKSNIATFFLNNIFNSIHPKIDQLHYQIPYVFLIVIVLTLAILWFLKTEHGMSMRAMGSNSTMATAQGISMRFYTLLGVGLANSFNALGGAIIVQYQGFADVKMGFGVLINGLAALIIGEAIVGRQTVFRQVLSPVVGALCFYQFFSLALSLGIPPSMMKLIIGGFVLFTLALPTLGKKMGPPPKEQSVRE